MKIFITIMLAFTTLCLNACSTSLSEQPTKPYIIIKNVQKDISDKLAPKVNFSYCINNPIDDDVYLKNAELFLDINSIPVKKNIVKIESDIKGLTESCYNLAFTTDALNSPKAASLLLENFFDKKYKISTKLNFDDEEYPFQKTSYEGILK